MAKISKIWTKKEEDYLKKHYRRMSIEELGKKFDVSTNAVRKKEKKLGLIREHPRRKRVKKAVSVARRWMKKEELYLQTHYLKETNVWLAKRFKTTAKSVEKKLWRMGLKRRRRASQSSEEESKRRKRIEEFLRDEHPPVMEEKKIDEHRSRAIAQFDVAIKLYYERKYGQAERAFGKLIKDFADVGDVVYKAKQYAAFCLSKK